MELHKIKSLGIKRKRKKKISDFKPSQKSVRLKFSYDNNFLKKNIELNNQLFGVPKKYTIAELPRSGNHQYLHGKGGNKYLDPKIIEFREKIRATVLTQGLWKPSGIMTVLIVFESNLWITKKRLVREMDADNKIKTLFDAIAKALFIRDEWFFVHQVFKIPSRKEMTTIYLWDMGDVVEYKI